MKKALCLIMTAVILVTVAAIPCGAVEFIDSTAVYVANGIEMVGSSTVKGDVIVSEGKAEFKGNPYVSGTVKIADGAEFTKTHGVRVNAGEYTGEKIIFPVYSFADAPSAEYFEGRAYADGSRKLTVEYYKNDADSVLSGYTLSEDANIKTLTVRPGLDLYISADEGETRIVKADTLSINGNLYVTGGGKVVIYTDNLTNGNRGSINKNGTADNLTIVLTGDANSILNFSKANANFVSGGSLSVSNTTLNGNIYVSGTSFKFDGNGEPVTGLVYAPAAEAKIGGSAALYGKLVTKSLSLSGNALISDREVSEIGSDIFAVLINGVDVSGGGQTGNETETDWVKVVKYDAEEKTFSRGTMKIKEHRPKGVDVSYYVLDETTFEEQDDAVDENTKAKLRAIATQTTAVFDLRSDEVSLYPFGRVDSQAFRYSLTISPYVVPFLEQQGFSADEMWLVWGSRTGVVETVWLQVK